MGTINGRPPHVGRGGLPFPAARMHLWVIYLRDWTQLLMF
jgi:hypothetical protein